MRGAIHRVAGIVLLVGSTYHVFFLLTARGRAFFRDMQAGCEDLRQFFQMMRYNLGRSAQDV